MKLYQWTPVLLAVALVGCPDKEDTGDTDIDTDTMDMDTDTMDVDTEEDTEADTEEDTELPSRAGEVVYFEGFETDGTAFPAGWTTDPVDGVTWKLCPTGEDCDGNGGALLAHADGDWYAAVDADGDGSSGTTYSATLTGPAIDLTEFADYGIEMSVSQWYRDLGDSDSASIEASADGVTWDVIQDYPAISDENNSSSNGPCPSLYDLSAYAGGTVQLRFNYASGWDWWFMVDSIELMLTDGAPAVPAGNAWDCPPEDCADGVDNDLDGLADCDDLDQAPEGCLDTVECPYVCPADTPITMPFTETADVSTLDTDIGYAGGEECTSGSGLAKIYQATIPAGQQLVVAETSGEDMVLRQLEGCVPGDTCLQSTDSPEELRIQAGDADETVYFVMQAWSSFNTEGEYNLTAEIVPPEDCASDADEDGDGDIACDDSDCDGTVSCFELDCTDGISGDDDDLVDCMDPDCADSADCVEMDCADGIDNEMDGFTDCEDDQCAGSVDCPETECEDGEDNDLDTLTDCDDDDCDTAEICFDCPDVAATLPLLLMGTDWTADYPDNGFDYAFSGGCTSSPDSGDYIFLVSANAGDTLVATEGDTDDIDMKINVIAVDAGGCVPAQNDNTCVFNDDDNFVRGGQDNYEYTFEASGDYYVYLTSFESSNADAYEISFDVVAPEDCSTDIDEDGDGDAGCADSDCAIDDACFSCPTGLTAGDFPFTISGGTWNDPTDGGYADLFDYTETNGCEGGSGGGGADYLVAVDMQIGDTISTVENSGGVDFIINITADDCRPTENANTCVYSSDDSPSDGTYSYTASAAAVHYIQLSSWSNTESDDFDLTFNFTPAAP